MELADYLPDQAAMYRQRAEQSDDSVVKNEMLLVGVGLRGRSSALQQFDLWQFRPLWRSQPVQAVRRRAEVIEPWSFHSRSPRI
jgi:hypothetical protein